MQTALLRTSKKKHARTDKVKKVLKPLQLFLTKLNNDWMMNSASALAYNLMVAIVPIAVAVFFILGITLGRLNPALQDQLITHVEHIFPSNNTVRNVLQPALVSLHKNAGFLGVLVALASIFGGSRLFISIEGYFDIIYRTYPRKIIAQNVMAILMMLVFIVLTPLMFFTSSVPALILTLAQNSGLNEIPLLAQLAKNGFLISVAGIIGSFIVCWILLETIYLVIPNQKISFQNSWIGAFAGAVMLQIFLFLFPLYITHFMGSYQGDAGFAVILLVFFYYFAVILLLGAEVNACFKEKIPPLTNNIAVVIHDASAPSTRGQAHTPDKDQVKHSVPVEATGKPPTKQVQSSASPAVRNDQAEAEQIQPLQERETSDEGNALSAGR